MFSFHKPKIYRSNLGCCICKAKSSSSRFTDSKKYENEFERCFRIQEKRSGEICNACVLLVKRWKKLSPENRLTKHWHHVVDARAGPGTKLTGNRRIVHHQSGAGGSQSSSSSAKKSSGANNNNSNNNKSDVLPLSSSQSNTNQSSGPARTRTNSLSKARAIDTNVSTFTFGEPIPAYRRNYMASEQASYSNYSSLSPLSTSNASSLSKPQSALNSSAFESVIKRFRQRQQQQHLEAQRRQQKRQKRLQVRQQQQQQHQQQQEEQQQRQSNSETQLPVVKAETKTSDDDRQQQQQQPDTLAVPASTKRVKRLSENYGSLAGYETLRVASVLDNSIWRKEKICCGTIFRGLFNEVAIFPNLLKPCECRLRKLEGDKSQDQAQEEPEDQANSIHKKGITEPESPPPRATKSGSISSSTSGTGSMEQPLEEQEQSAKLKQTTPRGQPTVKRPRSVPSKRRRQQGDDSESAGGSGSADSPSSGTSSGNSSSRMMLLIDGEEAVDDDDDDGELIMAEDDALELSNDASSSAESLLEIEGKNSSALAMG